MKRDGSSGPVEGRAAFGLRLLAVWAMGLAASGCFAGAFRCQETPAANPCENAMTTYDLRDCWGNQYKLADAELNRVYKEIMGRLPEVEKAKLRDAQRAWIPVKERKGEEAAKEYEGGTFAPVAKAIALTEETRARTAELKKAYGQHLKADPAPPPQPGAGTPPAAPPKTLGRSPDVAGSWVNVSGPSDFEAMDLVLEEGRRVFRSFLHDRPAWSGSWQVSENRLTVETEDGERFVWTIVSASPKTLVLRQEGETETTVFEKP